MSLNQLARTLRCQEDPIHFIEEYCLLPSYSIPTNTDIKLNTVQCCVLNEMQTSHACAMIAYRQSGITSVLAWYMFWNTFVNPEGYGKSNHFITFSSSSAISMIGHLSYIIEADIPKLESIGICTNDFEFSEYKIRNTKTKSEIRFGPASNAIVQMRGHGIHTVYIDNIWASNQTQYDELEDVLEQVKICGARIYQFQTGLSSNIPNPIENNPLLQLLPFYYNTAFTFEREKEYINMCGLLTYEKEYLLQRK